MAITYDKKMLRQMHKNVDGGKRKFAFKSSLFYSTIYFVFMLGMQYVIEFKRDTSFLFDLGFVGTWFMASIIMFIIMYISYLRQYKDMKAMYDESIKYFEKHDPGYIKELGF